MRCYDYYTLFDILCEDEFGLEIRELFDKIVEYDVAILFLIYSYDDFIYF